jgi:hypothetical protein
LPGFAGGYVLQGDLPSIAPHENYCADLYLEWHAIDGSLADSGLGDTVGEDEDGDGTDFDRVWAQESLMATYLNPSEACGGFNYPIFGDATPILESMGLLDCFDRLDIAIQGYVMSEDLSSWGNIFTYNAYMYSTTADPIYLSDDSEGDWNGTDGRIVMKFDPMCVQDINIRHIMLEFVNTGDESCVNSATGCTDPEAYNCEDDDGVNYTFEIGDIDYVNGCNYELDDYLEMEYVGGCGYGPCEGYYNPLANEDDGSCDYYQAPHGDDVSFTVEENSILIDWTNFEPPQNATILGYHIQRCTENGCVWITDSAFPWNDSNTGLDDTSILDEFAWEEGVEIKYAINVKYSNAESFGEAIGASYITPTLGNSCVELGDINGDGQWNVLDIVSLANCVLADSCDTLPYACAADVNADGNYNVLDIVSLANCVLADDCDEND